MPEETEGPAPKGACAVCQKPDGELCPCLGCETPYHQACIGGRGCLFAGCPLENLRGHHVLPRDPVAWQAAGVLGAVAVACLVGHMMSRAGGDLRTRQPFAIAEAVFGAAAIVCLIVGYLRDLRTPAARLLWWETIGRVMVLVACLLWIGSGYERTGALAGAGWVMFVIGVLTMTLRPGRKTHHPLRRSTGLPELALTFLAVWFIGGFTLMYFLTGGGSYRRERANTRACYANQKAIVGALEMYNLDKRTKLPFEPALFPALVSHGSLTSIPQDPGQGAATSGHYHATQGGNGLSCAVHGAIQ